jgi:hypothetical protein
MSLTAARAARVARRLKEFEDDEIKVAQKDATEVPDNPVMNWFNSLDSPLNDGSGWGNPLKRN